MNDAVIIVAKTHGGNLNPWVFLGLSLFVHLLGWASFVVIRSGIRDGYTGFAFGPRYRPAKRVERATAPIAFWSSIGFYAVAGAAFTIGGACGAYSAIREVLATR